MVTLNLRQIIGQHVAPVIPIVAAPFAVIEPMLDALRVQELLQQEKAQQDLERAKKDLEFLLKELNNKPLPTKPAPPKTMRPIG